LPNSRANERFGSHIREPIAGSWNAELSPQPVKAFARDRDTFRIAFSGSQEHFILRFLRKMG
jgi:hypothetical protein